MFELVNQKHRKKINQFLSQLKPSSSDKIDKALNEIIQNIYDAIPPKKRISYGRYSVIKRLGIFIYPLLKEKGSDAYDLGSRLYLDQQANPFLRSFGLQLMSLLAEEKGPFKKIINFFEKAAKDKSWEVRECSAGFIRKIVKAYPLEMKKWYLKMSNSKDDKQRRFVVESLRPVADNHWLKKNSNYAFSILQLFYKESSVYPRTSTGNSLSDWMRIDQEKTLKIVKTLANNNDKNSYWIAYRACRNLVKKEPLLVMDILKIDHYKYKDRIFNRP